MIQRGRDLKKNHGKVKKESHVSLEIIKKPMPACSSGRYVKGWWGHFPFQIFKEMGFFPANF